MKFNRLNQQCLIPPRLWDKQLRNNLSGWTETRPFQNCHQDEDPRYLVSPFPMEGAASKLTYVLVAGFPPSGTPMVISILLWLLFLICLPFLEFFPISLTWEKNSKRKFPNHRNHNLLGDHYHFTVFHYSCPMCERKGWQGYEDKGQGLQLWPLNSPSLTLYHSLPHRADSFCPEPFFLYTASLCVYTKVISSSMW